MSEDSLKSQYATFLPHDDEAMLRKLAQLDRNREQHASGFILEVHRNSPEGTLVRHLDQAKMISVVYGSNNRILVAEVLMSGYEYIEKKDAEIKNEARRKNDLKKSRRHDWAIAIVPSAISLIATIAGTVIGTLAGYTLGSS